MRIVAGSKKGHRIAAPKGVVTRPTGDRVREAAFSLVGPVAGAAVLDLFAGSGAMGLEALSRGAASCVFVERDREATRVIQSNLEKLQLTGAVVANRNVDTVLRDESSRGRRYDLVLADPPYEEWKTHEPTLAELLPACSCRRCARRRRDVREGGACASARPRHEPAVRFRADYGLLAMITAICPGSYDPVTNGHVDVIRRAAAIFDRVVVGVVRDPTHKETLFTVEERVDFLEDALSGSSNVVVDVFSALVVEFARKHEATTMVKGLRVISDFEWEFQMNHLNRQLAPDIETLYVMANPLYSFVSSSGVKEIASFGGKVDTLVPPAVARRFTELYPDGRPGAPVSPQE